MRSLVLLIAAAVFLAAGCAPPASGRVYSRDDARTAWSVFRGSVTRVDQVVIEGQRTDLGHIGGGMIGYELGHGVGHGAGSDIAGAVGAVAGAVAGQAVEERATRAAGYQITVVLDDGRTLAVVQAQDQSFAVGERVRVFTRQDGAARVAKD